MPWIKLITLAFQLASYFIKEAERRGIIKQHTATLKLEMLEDMQEIDDEVFNDRMLARAEWLRRNKDKNGDA